MSRRPARAGIPTDDSILQEESSMKKKRTWTALILIAAPDTDIRCASEL